MVSSDRGLTFVTSSLTKGPGRRGGWMKYSKYKYVDKHNTTFGRGGVKNQAFRHHIWMPHVWYHFPVSYSPIESTYDSRPRPASLQPAPSAWQLGYVYILCSGKISSFLYLTLVPEELLFSFILRRACSLKIQAAEQYQKSVHSQLQERTDWSPYTCCHFRIS